MSWLWRDAGLNTMRGSIVVSYTPQTSVLPSFLRLGSTKVNDTDVVESVTSGHALEMSAGSGRSASSNGFMRLTPDEPEDASQPSATEVNLSSRQREVLRLIVQGRSNKEIARLLRLAEGTIKIHLAALFNKLGVRRRAALAVVGSNLLQAKRL